MSGYDEEQGNKGGFTGRLYVRRRRSGLLGLVGDPERKIALFVHLRVKSLVAEYFRRSGLDEDARSPFFDHLVTGCRTINQGELEGGCASVPLRHDAQARVA